MDAGSTYWLEAIRHRRAISRLQREHERYSDEIHEKIEAAEKAKERDEYDHLVSDYLNEEDLFQNEIASRETKFLTREARRYMIPVPPAKEGEGWERDRIDGRLYLTFAAMRDLRNSIREERRLRAEPVTIWLPLAIGLIGAATGLAAVLH